jgi:hypothetical protein
MKQETLPEAHEGFIMESSTWRAEQQPGLESKTDGPVEDRRALSACAHHPGKWRNRRRERLEQV